MVTNGKEGMIAPLHGLRGVAALTVITGHLLPLFPLAPSLGVVLFFLLSGYLMGRLYLPKEFNTQEVYTYIVARIARIYPLFASLVLLSGLVALVRNDIGLFGMTVSDVPYHLLFAGDGTTIWTISVEFQFYALFVILWGIAHLSRLGSLLASAILVAVVIVGFSIHFTGRIDILRYLHIFSLGVLISILQHKFQITDNSRKLAGLILPISLAAYLFLFLVIKQFYDHELVYGDPVVVSICFLVVGSAVITTESYAARILSSRPLFWLGEMSFGIYLLHRPVQLVCERLPVIGANPYLFFVVAVAVTLVLASFANRLLEVPARKWVRSYLMGFRWPLPQ